MGGVCGQVCGWQVQEKDQRLSVVALRPLPSQQSAHPACQAPPSASLPFQSPSKIKDLGTLPSEAFEKYRGRGAKVGPCGGAGGGDKPLSLSPPLCPSTPLLTFPLLCPYPRRPTPTPPHPQSTPQGPPPRPVARPGRAGRLRPRQPQGSGPVRELHRAEGGAAAAAGGGPHGGCARGGRCGGGGAFGMGSCRWARPRVYGLSRPPTSPFQPPVSLPPPHTHTTTTTTKQSPRSAS